jgi:hypothetical protein
MERRGDRSEEAEGKNIARCLREQQIQDLVDDAMRSAGS